MYSGCFVSISLSFKTNAWLMFRGVVVMVLVLVCGGVEPPGVLGAGEILGCGIGGFQVIGIDRLDGHNLM